MPNKLTAAIVALAIVIATAVPLIVGSARTAAAPSIATVTAPRAHSSVDVQGRLDAFGMAGVGLHRLGLFLVALDRHNRDVWIFTARAHEAEAEAARGAGTSTSSTAVAASSASTSGACGGDLPPCWIMERESGGNIRAMNPSGAAGKWQIMPGTWNGFMGYASAADAPEWVQDAKARTMALCNWQPPNYCA